MLLSDVQVVLSNDVRPKRTSALYLSVPMPLPTTVTLDAPVPAAFNVTEELANEPS